MIIGLTGLYCAGKNRVGALLEKQGIPVLDADRLGHDVIEDETERIVQRFGEKILDASPRINRQLLGKCVFGRPEELAALEAIVHPGVNRLVEEWITQNMDAGVLVLNAALLHKSAIYKENKLDAIIVVHAPFPVRFFRALKRDKRSLWELLKRFRSQKKFPRYQKAVTCLKTGENRPQLFIPSADIYTIRNSGFSGSARMLEKRIDAFLSKLC